MGRQRTKGKQVSWETVLRRKDRGQQPEREGVGEVFSEGVQHNLPRDPIAARA